MLYKKGDRVVVRPDLNGNDTYHMSDQDMWNVATEEMVALAGRVVTISHVGRQYEVEEDPCGWDWTDEMFIGLESGLDDDWDAPANTTDYDAFFGKEPT